MRSLSLGGCLGCTGWEVGSALGVYHANFSIFQRANLQPLASSWLGSLFSLGCPWGPKQKLQTWNCPLLWPCFSAVAWTSGETLTGIRRCLWHRGTASTTPRLPSSRSYGTAKHLTLRTSLGLSLGLSQIHVKSNSDDQTLEAGTVFKLGTRETMAPNNLKGTKDFRARTQTLSHDWWQAAELTIRMANFLSLLKLCKC